VRPAVVYAAKSTLDQKGSIPTQLSDGCELAKHDGLTVIAEYADENRSAYHGNRGRDLARAQEHAARLASEHGECALIIQHSDRLARGDGIQAAHLVEYALWAIKAGVKLRSVQDPQTFGDLLYTVVTGQRNHEDSRRKGLAVRDGLERRARKGLVSTRPPYGYRFRQHLADEDAELEIVPGQAIIVRRIFAEFLAGRSMTSIARGLHREGVRTRDGGMWRQSTITQMLPNPIYVGMIRYHDELLSGRHDPIIDSDVWARTQRLLAARPAKGRGRLPNGNHLFRGGLLRCECGWALVPRTNGRGHQVYYCSGRHAQGRAFCQTPHLWRSRIDTAVYNYFSQVALDVEATRRALAESHECKLAEIRSLLAESEQEAQHAEERLARVRRDYADGRIDAEDWREFRAELAAERDAAAAQAARHQASEAEVAAAANAIDAEHAALRQLAAIRRSIAGDIQRAEGVEAVRAALTRLFDAFVVHRSTPRRVHVELAGCDYWIEPIVREDMMGEGGPSGMPRPLREPLSIGTETINRAAGAGAPSARCARIATAAGARATASASARAASASARSCRARARSHSRAAVRAACSSSSRDDARSGRRAQSSSRLGVAPARCKISVTISCSMRATCAIRWGGTPALCAPTTRASSAAIACRTASKPAASRRTLGRAGPPKSITLSAAS
jgi:DNA invertase Pin-like site-specific DNA recombinase